MSRGDARQGFTLIEIMVAVTIMAILTAQLLMVFSTQHVNTTRQERVTEVQQDARLVMEMMLVDARLAGFMVPSIAAVSSIDGGNNGSDVFCASDPRAINEGSLAAASSLFDRALLQVVLGPSQGSVTLVASTMDIDSNGTDDFTVGGGIIISDSTKTHCARIGSIAGNAISFTPNTPLGFSASTAQGRAVPALIYQVTADGLERNGVTLSTQVEDLQAEFGVDVNADGEVVGAEFPIHDLDASDLSLVRTVRLTITTRTPSEDPLFTGSGFPAAANRLAGAADGFRRRRVAAGAVLRNLR